MATAARYLLSHVEDYPAKKQELLASPAPHFVLFNADPDPATGLPWCPDCVRTVPTVKSVVEAAGGTLLEVQVGPRAAWKTPDHPFRLDTTLRLTGIPTLLKLSASGEESVRLGKTLEECRTPKAVEELMAPLVKDT